MRAIPKTSLLYAFRAERPSYPLLCGETIDNSLDAAASSVQIEIENDRIIVRDNGIGLTADRLEAFITLGEHGHMASTRLGMFGIGMKMQALKAARKFDVESNSKDGHLEWGWNWDQVEREGTWDFPEPSWRRCRAKETFGTTIWMSSYRAQPPRGRDIEKIATDLRKWFYPALLMGSRITLNEQVLQAAPEPRLTERLSGQIELEPGKGVTYMAGLLAEPGPWYRVHVAYAHRVILPESHFGCGAYGGLRRFFARVTLFGAWKLSRFKDEIVDADADALEEALQSAWRPLLEQCEAKELDLTVNEVTRELNAMLPPELVCARPPHKKPPGPSTPSPHPRRPHGKTSEGETSGPARRLRPPSNQLKIEFEDGLHAEYGYGTFQEGKPARILLAKDNPHVALWLNARDRAMGLAALYSIASSLYIEYRQHRQPDMFTPDDPFGLRMWKLMREQNLSTPPTNP
jgi:Histidine kinase-, DNA gyrase B-, and HSP90-like ATPase